MELTNKVVLSLFLFLEMEITLHNYNSAVTHIKSQSESNVNTKEELRMECGDNPEEAKVKHDKQ